MRLISMTVPLQRRATVVLACPALFAIGALLFGTGPAGSCAIEPTAGVDGSTSAKTTPLQVYRASCLECHDNDGRGGIVRDDLPTVPDFTVAKWHASRSDAELSR